MTFFSGLLFGHFIDGWLFLHNWVEGWILLKLFFYRLLIDGLKVHKSACNPWKCCESCKPYKSNATFNAGNNHGEKNSFSNLSVLSNFTSTARSSDVASPKCWNLVWDTASRSKKRQDMLQMWEGHGSCNPPGIRCGVLSKVLFVGGTFVRTLQPASFCRERSRSSCTRECVSNWGLKDAVLEQQTLKQWKTSNPFSDQTKQLWVAIGGNKKQYLQSGAQI